MTATTTETARTTTVIGSGGRSRHRPRLRRQPAEPPPGAAASGSTICVGWSAGSPAGEADRYGGGGSGPACRRPCGKPPTQRAGCRAHSSMRPHGGGAGRLRRLFVRPPTRSRVDCRFSPRLGPDASVVVHRTFGREELQRFVRSAQQARGRPRALPRGYRWLVKVSSYGELRNPEVGLSPAGRVRGSRIESRAATMNLRPRRAVWMGHGEGRGRTHPSGGDDGAPTERVCVGA